MLGDFNIYNLKHKYPTALIICQTVSSVVDWSTGVKTEARNTFEVKKAVVLQLTDKNLLGIQRTNIKVNDQIAYIDVRDIPNYVGQSTDYVLIGGVRFDILTSGLCAAQKVYAFHLRGIQLQPVNLSIQANVDSRINVADEVITT